MGVSQLTTRLHPEEAIFSWQSKLKMHAPNIRKQPEHHCLPINMLKVSTLASIWQNHLTQRLLITQVKSWIRRGYYTKCRIQSCSMGKLGCHYTVERNIYIYYTNQTIARQKLSRVLRSRLSTVLMKYELFMVIFPNTSIMSDISSWHQTDGPNITQGQRCVSTPCFKCWKTHDGSVAVLMHAGHTLR